MRTYSSQFDTKALIGLRLIPIRNLIMRRYHQWRESANLAAAKVEKLKINQAFADEKEFQTRAANHRSAALEYK